MPRSIVGLMSAPGGCQHVLVYADDVLSIFMDAFATMPSHAPLVSDLDAWIGARCSEGVECVVMLPIYPVPVAAFTRRAMVGGAMRIIPELRGMAQEPWAGVIRAMKARLDGGANTLPAGFTFQPAATVVLAREHATC